MLLKNRLIRCFSNRSSLVPETLQEIANDVSASKSNPAEAKRLTRDERKQRMRALDNLNIPSFKQYLEYQSLNITRKPASILQLNLQQKTI